MADWHGGSWQDDNIIIGTKLWNMQYGGWLL